MEEKEIIERLIAVEEARKSNTKRIDEHDKVIKELSNVYVALTKVDNKVSNMETDVSEIKTDLKEIKEKPIKEYEENKKEVKKQVVSFFVGIILTAIAFALGLNKFM